MPAQKPKVLIIEDEADIIEFMQYNLEREGFVVFSARDGERGFSEAVKRKPSLILLDLMLPSMDGTELCRLLKEKEQTKSIPIIMVTAKGEESDKVLGLGMGADDYVTKPFSPKELAARIRAVLRRSSPSEDNASRVEFGPISIDSFRHEVRVRDKELILTTAEFRLLKALVSQPGRVYSRDQLLEKITAGESVVLDRNVDVHIGSIRKKLGADGDMIATVRGVGYKLKD
jgi:DNA-binding response OmpR family regulator